MELSHKHQVFLTVTIVAVLFIIILLMMGPTIRGLNLSKEFNQAKRAKLVEIIKKYKPEKVFFHSIRDGHPDHSFVSKTMTEIIEKLEIKPEIYTFQVNLLGFSEKEESKVIYDISREYKKKFSALNAFKTQKPSIILLKPFIILRGIRTGKKIDVGFAEQFYGE